MENKIEEIGTHRNERIGVGEGQDETRDASNNELKKLKGKDADQHLSKYQKKYKPGKGAKRYNNSLKHLIPIRKKEIDFREKESMPIDRAGLFSFVTLSWISNVMNRAQSPGLKMEELPKISPYDTCDYNADRLEHLWREELAKKGTARASFTRVAWRFCRTRLLISTAILICGFIITFLLFTYFMRKVVEHVQYGDGSYYDGLKWSMLFIACGMIRLILIATAWSLNHRTGLRLRSACLGLLYRKIVCLNYLGNRNIGEVINMFSNDAQRIFDMIFLGPLMIEAPIITIYTTGYVLQFFGPMALIGIIVFFVFFPLQYFISRLIGRLRAKALKISDLRVRLMNEILDYIKLIKMYAWEKRFSKDLLSIRKKERNVILKTSYYQSFNVAVAPVVPIISATVTFLVHIAVGNNLTAAQVFPYLSFLDSRFRVSLTLFQQSLTSVVFGGVSLNRIKDILLLEENKCTISKPIVKSQAVAIINGTFAYNNFDDDNKKSSKTDDDKRNNADISSGENGEQEKLNKHSDNAEQVDILFDIFFEAAKGKLIGICGHVGSGKSSLLLAALGQLRVSEGQVMRDGSCAYVSQQAWITNATLRENILFGAEYDHSRYHKAIYACNLSQDIDMMPGGDRTEIGEKGVNLSGGQKQRVALARALYADRDIYFLDDPLSAVDSRVGSYIFDNLLLGALKEKTVLFVTHQIQYLNRCDDVYMMRDGRIVEHGTHDELIKLGNEYAAMVPAISSNIKAEDETSADEKYEAHPQSTDIIPVNKGSRDNGTTNIAEKSDAPNAKLTVTDNLQRGSIKAHAYHAYIVATGGYIFFFMVMLMFLLNVGSTALSSWWLAVWIEAGGGNTTVIQNNVTIVSDNINDNPDFWYYQAIYVGTMGVMIASTAIRILIFTKATIDASSKIHNNLFKKITASPMRFFDTTPSGRIQHLFSRDMDEVDNRLPETLADCLHTVIKLIVVILMTCLALPWFVIPFGILTAIYHFINRRYGLATRDLKRMENKSRAPVISFATATIQGLSTIRAFGKENDFISTFDDFFDEQSKYVYLFHTALRWLVMRVESITVAMMGVTAILIVVSQNQIPAALAGLALTYSAQIATILPFSIRLLSETDVRFTSVEKLNHYIRILETEGSKNKPTTKPPSAWPAVAKITFRNVSMAYGENSPIILENLSFSITAGEKIGIVGRTGSGKSSLTVALFRLVELAEGTIEIDDVDISKISLEQLRTKLSIIPQDPVLFSGTIRSNLDPFKLYTDAEIWEALEKTELKDKVKSIIGQLDASVGFGGDNLSAGEKQLLCLARALLRNSKILVLDEATAAVDPETEKAVQDTVQREFVNCTILTIAHRLQTVLSLDRIMVMDSGKILEFDTPSNLSGNPNSEFSRMMAAAKQAESQ